MLEERDFAVYDNERQAWRMEGGVYKIEVGSSSVDLPLRAEVTVLEDAKSARRVFTPMTLVKHFLADQAARALLMQNFGGTRVEQWLTGDNEMFLSIPIMKMADFGDIPRKSLSSWWNRSIKAPENLFNKRILA